MRLIVSLSHLISVTQTSSERYDTVLTLCRRSLELGMLKSKGLGEMFAHLKKLVNTKDKAKNVTSEVMVKAKNVWHKMFATSGKLSVIECSL